MFYHICRHKSRKIGKCYVKETKVMPGKIKSPDFNVTIDNEANYQPTYWYTVTNKDKITYKCYMSEMIPVVIIEEED